MREPRLGDDIDDYCVRCKRVMNHNVVSVVNGEAAKVRCRTCHSDHDYRHEQPPPPKIDARKAALFNEVLKKVSPGETPVAVDDVELDPAVDLEVDSDTESEGEAAEVEAEAESKPAPVAEEAPKAKKGRGRPRKA